jgi:hypothetical protein
MKKAIFFLFFASALAPAGAQETSQGGAAKSGPTMPRLFYTKEQRRVLEAVRQEVIDVEDVIDEDQFLSLEVEEDALDLAVVTNESSPEAAPRRGALVRINGYIRKKGEEGKSVFWINSEMISQEEKDVLLRRGGLDIAFDAKDGVIEGNDQYNKSEFSVKVGQVITPEGFVDETLPVVVRKTK